MQKGDNIGTFNASINSKKYHVVHVGTYIQKDKNEIPHAILMGYDAKKELSSDMYTLNDISFIVSNFRTEDDEIVVESIVYKEKEIKFIIKLKVVKKTPKADAKHHFYKDSTNYMIDDVLKKFYFKGSTVLVKRGTLIDFKVGFNEEKDSKPVTIFNTPVIECKIQLN